MESSTMLCWSFDNLLNSMVFRPVRSTLSLILLQTLSNLDVVEQLTNLNWSSSNFVLSLSDSRGTTYFLLFFGSVAFFFVASFFFYASSWAFCAIALMVGLFCAMSATFFSLGWGAGGALAFLFMTLVLICASSTSSSSVPSSASSLRAWVSPWFLSPSSSMFLP